MKSVSLCKQISKNYFLGRKPQGWGKCFHPQEQSFKLKVSLHIPLTLMSWFPNFSCHFPGAVLPAPAISQELCSLLPHFVHAWKPIVPQFTKQHNFPSNHHHVLSFCIFFSMAQVLLQKVHPSSPSQPSWNTTLKSSVNISVKRSQYLLEISHHNLDSLVSTLCYAFWSLKRKLAAALVDSTLFMNFKHFCKCLHRKGGKVFW